MKMESEKAKRFKRVASNRVEKVLQSIQNLEKCSNKTNYEYTQAEVEKMIKAIKDELRILESSFRNSNKKNESFKF